MISKATHYGHPGYEVYKKEEDKRRWFVFRHEMKFDDESTKDLVKIQIIRYMKRKGEEFPQWHFSNRYKGSKYENVSWPYVLSGEIAQIIMNCVDEKDIAGRQAISQDSPATTATDKDLAEAGI